MAAKEVPKGQMEYRQLGKDGPSVSCIGLGCFAFGGDRKVGQLVSTAAFLFWEVVCTHLSSLGQRHNCPLALLQTGSHLGTEFSSLHKGVWGDQSDEATYETVKAALDEGINFFDTAEMYGGWRDT
jgi:aryl-alcohol dehydrogenase-like predicted oxidoreductase